MVNCTEPSCSVVPCFASSASNSSYFERSNLIDIDRQEGEADELADEHADRLTDWPADGLKSWQTDSQHASREIDG